MSRFHNNRQDEVIVVMKGLVLSQRERGGIKYRRSNG